MSGQITGLKILGRASTPIFFSIIFISGKKYNFMHFQNAYNFIFPPENLKKNSRFHQ